MMQTADQREFDHVSTIRRLYRSGDGTVVVKGSMGTYFMIILEIRFEKLAQLPFMEHDHAIEAFTPN